MAKPSNKAAYYRALLAGANSSSFLESTTSAEADFSPGGVKKRMKRTRKELDRIIKKYFGDQPHLHEIAELIEKRGDRALGLVSDDRDEELNNKMVINTLEAIVRTDGSRPSFLVRKGEVDLKSSPVGNWETTLIASQSDLPDLFTRIGRIDDPTLGGQGFAGTGFLIHQDYLITNRHVLQLIGARTSNGTWKLSKDAAIDFGHEFRVTGKAIRRKLKDVVFTGNQPIRTLGPVDHAKLDLALIELEPAKPDEIPKGKFCLDISQDWAERGVSVYTIGYPGEPPGGTDPFSLLEQLFQLTWGKKRIAPGQIMTGDAGLPSWTCSHDATTLGGNSGSIIVAIGREGLAAGLHYGGRSRDPRVNWGHVLGSTLSETDGVNTASLSEVLKKIGVCFVDRRTA